VAGATPQLTIVDDAASAAARGAALIAAQLRTRAQDHGRATLAVSGGRTPQRMLELLARDTLPWERLDVLQVDERVVADGHAERNATQARAALAAPIARHPERFHWMPVTAPDLDAAARDYASTLRAVAGDDPVLDVVHLGLGADGHTASIFPGSAVAEETRAAVAVTDERLGRRRMTLTLPVLDRARLILWIVTGTDKRDALARLIAGDPALIASRVRRNGAVIVADLEAAAAIT
jgi:6-phosphogluconolactonase